MVAWDMIQLRFEVVTVAQSAVTRRASPTPGPRRVRPRTAPPRSRGAPPGPRAASRPDAPRPIALPAPATTQPRADDAARHRRPATRGARRPIGPPLRDTQIGRAS